MIASFVRAKRRVWCSWAIRNSFGQGQAGRASFYLSQPRNTHLGDGGLVFPTSWVNRCMPGTSTAARFSHS